MRCKNCCSWANRAVQLLLGSASPSAPLGVFGGPFGSRGVFGAGVAFGVFGDASAEKENFDPFSVFSSTPSASFEGSRFGGVLCCRDPIGVVGAELLTRTRRFDGVCLGDDDGGCGNVGEKMGAGRRFVYPGGNASASRCRAGLVSWNSART